MGRGFGSPRRRPTTRRTLFCTGLACVRKRQARRTLAVRVVRGPATRMDRQGSPRLLGRPCIRAVVCYPASGDSPSPFAVVSPTAFSVIDRLGFPGSIAFRGWIRTAHMLACLRINRGVATPTARLATDLRGYALIGRDLHPLDDKPNFRSHRMTSSFRTNMAWSLPMMQRCNDRDTGMSPDTTVPSCAGCPIDTRFSCGQAHFAIAPISASQRTSVPTVPAWATQCQRGHHLKKGDWPPARYPKIHVFFDT
jgi:hypothetical protein